MNEYSFIPLLFVYLLLPFYTTFGGWRRTADRPQIRLLWFLVLPLAAFCTLWYCSRGIWTIVWFFFADEGYWEQYGNWTAGIVAMSVSAILVIRMATGRFTHRYLRINSWGVTTIAALYCAVLTEHFIDGIDGWTARGAAENHFARVRIQNSAVIRSKEDRRMVEVKPPKEVTPERPARKFALYEGENRVAEVVVVPYGWWWWHKASSITGPSIDKFDGDE